MQDQQNQKRTEQTPRRRRAVRSVPMGSPNDAVPSQPPQATVEPEIQNPLQPPAVSAPVPARPAPTIEKTLSTASADPEKTASAAVPESEKASMPQTDTNTVPVNDAVSAARTFTHHVQPQKSRSSSLSPVTLTAVLAVIAVLCILAVLPFFGKTEAVMLYVDETAVGYLTHEDTASEQMERVLEDLYIDKVLQPDAVLYRCETAQVQGDIDYLSSDDVYDVLLAQATDGYVRAYWMYRDGCVESDEIIGVLTEAEIFAARDAVISYYTELYTPNLPTGAELSITPNYTEFNMWNVGWIPESALLDSEQLAASWIETQDIYPRFNIWGYWTETEAERIPYETTLVTNDESFDGIRSMISPGADGLAQVSYKIWFNPATGEEIRRDELSRVVVREPVSAVSYEGLYPLPDGVSTGTFDWPLPDLPDDELPLDENGNPYVPENPLALKNTYVSSGYGWRILWGVDDFHLGLDIVAPAYTEIYAADGGVVVFAAFTSSYGYMTRIRHADNVETVYAHQIKQVVKPGDVVEKGQLIGYVGSTGNSSGSHLHLEFRRDHVTVDPLEYITIPEEITVLGEGY